MCLLVALAAGIDLTALKPEGYVSDFAHVIDPASRAQLEQYCAAVKNATGVEMALVTVETLGGEPVEDAANALYRAWGVGNKQTNEGVLLLLAIADRRSRLEVGYGLEPVITDGDAGEILRAMRPYLRANQYGPAMLEAAQEIGGRIAKAKNVAIEQLPVPRPRRRESEAHIPVGLVFLLGSIGIILFGFLSSLIGGGRGGRTRGGFGGFLPGLILGNMMGRSIDFRRGGGGFGGYDSGGGFGGFGGGDSGGGGASSSW